jgi:hypothetical protein
MTRRIVTGNKPNGKSYVVSNEIVPDMALWDTTGNDTLGGQSSQLLPTTAPNLEPAGGGSKCLHVTLQPWKIMKPVLERGEIPGVDAKGFHRTNTVDYIMMIDGEVTLLLDEGEVTLGAGDLVVQRNTNHAWHVRGDTPANFWGVMVSADRKEQT